MTLIGTAVSLKPTQGAYQKTFTGVIVAETKAQFTVRSVELGERKFKKADGMPVARYHQQFPCYRAEVQRAEQADKAVPGSAGGAG